MAFDHFLTYFQVWRQQMRDKTRKMWRAACKNGGKMSLFVIFWSTCSRGRSWPRTRHTGA